jgi:hypothetical protein
VFCYPIEAALVADLNHRKSTPFPNSLVGIMFIKQVEIDQICAYTASSTSGHGSTIRTKLEGNSKDVQDKDFVSFQLLECWNRQKHKWPTDLFQASWQRSVAYIKGGKPTDLNIIF